MTIYGCVWARFTPALPTEALRSQVGWNLHVCLKTEERAAVCFLVEVFCVKTCQGYLVKCIPSKMFLYDQNHNVEQLLVNQTSSKSFVPDHQRNYELNLLCLPSSNPTYRTWTHGGKIKKEAEVSSFYWAALSHDSPTLPYWVGPDCEWEELDSWQVDE